MSESNPKKWLILFVEDEETVRKPYKAIFEKNGWDCIAVPDVAQGKEAFLSHKISIVILDWLLSGYQTGGELLEFIRERDPLLPVIVLSGALPEESRTDSLLLMADAYLQKPCSVGVLTTYLRQWFRRLAASPQQFLPRSIDEIRPLADVRHEYISKAVMLMDGNISAAARKLEVERHTINSILTRRPDRDRIHPEPMEES